MYAFTKRTLISAIYCAVALSTAGLTTPVSAEIQDFYIRNNGGNYVWYIYVSPNYSDSWEDDVLGKDVLDPYTEILIEMTGFGKQCIFDVKVEDENGYAREYYDVDLCSVLYVDFP